MKGSGLLALAASFSVALAAPLTSDGKVSHEEILETILENPILLPRSLHKTLHARVHGLMKRQAPPAAGAKGKGSGFDLSAILSGLLAPPKNAPKSLVADVQDLKPKGAWGYPEAKRSKIRYGPYRIPAITEKNLQSELMHVQGMSDQFAIGAKKPCSDKCTLLSLVADLEYADGSPANNANGAWLHHTVLLNSGPNVVEPNCGTGTAGKGAPAGARVENIFMSGNERTTGGFALPNSTVQSGYALTPSDTFIMQIELMNLHDREKWVWLTVDYEYLAGDHPTFAQGKTVWMTIGPAGGFCSRVKSPWGPTNLTLTQQPKSLVFSEHSAIWSSPKDGFLLGTGGHMHDGGVDIRIVHQGKVVCIAEAHYGKKGEKGGMGKKKRQVKGGEYQNSDIAHIAKQGVCNFPDGLPLKAGDQMYIEANYDFQRYPGMKNTKGDLDEVMGISGNLVAFPRVAK